jgi:hypothetical protein
MTLTPNPLSVSKSENRLQLHHYSICVNVIPLLFPRAFMAYEKGETYLNHFNIHDL